MSHDVMLPECKVEHSLFQDHLKDAPSMREKITTHDARIEMLFRFFDDVKDIKKFLLGGVLSIVFTVLLASMGLAVTWGRILEKVDRLERLSQQNMEEKL